MGVRGWAPTATVLERQIQHAYFQLEQQLVSYSGLDAKVTTVLSANAVLVGLLFAAKPTLMQLGWIARGALGSVALSVLTGLVSLWIRRAFAGPFPAAFYRKYKSVAPVTADAHLLSDLADALDTNDRTLSWKALARSVSTSALVVAALCTLVIRLLPAYTVK